MKKHDRPHSPNPPRHDLRPFTRHDLDAVSVRKRKLPHWELSGSTYFVTFRVRKSLGRVFEVRKKANGQPGKAVLHPTSDEAVLHQHPTPRANLEREANGQPGKAVLHQADARASSPARIVWGALSFFDRDRYVLDAYVIMPDHVHLLICPLSRWSLGEILQALKGFTARRINTILGRQGRFWQRDNFDHLIRDEDDFLDKLQYIRDNPVSAGLVEKPEDYPLSSFWSGV